MITLQTERGGVQPMAAVARCTDCRRSTRRVTPAEARLWAKAHRCERLTETEAQELAKAGAALAFTADRGWHLIPMAEALAVIAQAC